MTKNRITIHTKDVRFPAAPDLYGLFFEDINRAADGGLYPEMLRNRAFEDSLVPEGCTTDADQVIIRSEFKWPGAFHHGEGIDEWAEAVPETSVPAWYADRAVFELDTEDTLNPNRKAALSVNFEAGGFIENIGFTGVPVRKGEQYLFSCFIKASRDTRLRIELAGGSVSCASGEIRLTGSGRYEAYKLTLKAAETDFNSKLRIISEESCTVKIGFTSLLPEKTFCGHGLREDLALALKNTHSRFIRFPGGCVVEGINEENTLAFHKTIGPVHERPSSWLMWHYRTTNGLGFHEYLQLCEDLGMEALYVVNCGISCQGRGAHGYSSEKTAKYLKEALNALEYALGPEDSEFGSLRKKYGHAAPFRLKYVEIGNENGGPEYFERYRMFYDALKKAYPDVIYISNAHTEYEGLKTEVVDEHYYNSPEYFYERESMFDRYDRKGPKILIGEYAVYMLMNKDDVLASQKCALGEAVFLAGVERNQDIVRLAAYAPLFQNCNYIGWRPDLIVFDNHRVYGIPSYHVISLMGKYHGTQVIAFENASETVPALYRGVPGIMNPDGPVEFKNARINGRPAGPVNIIHGECTEEDGIYKVIPTVKRKPCVGKCEEWNRAMQTFAESRSFRRGNPAWAVFGEDDLDELVFEIDVMIRRDQAVNLNIWNSYPNTDFGTNEPKGTEWTDFLVRNQAWHIEKGFGSTRTPTFYDLPLSPEELTPLDLRYDEFNHFMICCDKTGYSCYLNGTFIKRQELKLQPRITASCEATEDEIYVKLINTEDSAQDIAILPDCAVEKKVSVERITAPPDAVNSFETPENVSSVSETISFTGDELLYRIPGNTLAVIVLKKEKSF